MSTQAIYRAISKQTSQKRRVTHPVKICAHCTNVSDARHDSSVLFATFFSLRGMRLRRKYGAILRVGVEVVDDEGQERL